MHESNTIQALIPLMKILKRKSIGLIFFELCSGINRCQITSLVGKKSRAEIFLKSQYIYLLQIVQRLCFNLDEEENKMNLLCIFFTHTHTAFSYEWKNPYIHNNSFGGIYEQRSGAVGKLNTNQHPSPKHIQPISGYHVWVGSGRVGPSQAPTRPTICNGFI